MKWDHQQAIEEKDNQIEALAFSKEEHQQQILRPNENINDLIANRCVAHRGCFDNVLCLIKRNIREVHPYYLIQCQYRQLEKHKRWLKLRYPNMEVADECDDPNAIYRWCRFKSEGDQETKLLQKPFQPDQRERSPS